MDLISDVSIESLRFTSLAEIVEIEAASFPAPWGCSQIARWRSHRDSIARVAIDGDCMVAGCLFYRINQRRGVTIHRIAVAPEWRRCGIGRLLIEDLAARMSFANRVVCRVTSQVQDVRANVFFAACGFRAVRCVDDQIDFLRIVEPGNGPAD